MHIITTYPNGTTTSHNGVQSGYEPDRTDHALHIHIDLDPYHIHICPYHIEVHYKYIRMRYAARYYKIGKWLYPIETINSNRERKHLIHMAEILSELLNETSINGVKIKDWRLLSVLESHKE